jgi:hypothetical protein
MSCPIHDRCTCYGSSLQYTATMTTAATPSGSSQFAPQTNNIFVGYEWAAPLVTTTSAGWYPLESLMIQSPTSHSGQDTLLHSDSHCLHNAHEASSHRNPYHREPHGYEREQKQVPLRPREQVRFPHSSVFHPGLIPKLACSRAPVSYTVHSRLFSNGLAQQLLGTIGATLSSSSKWHGIWLCELRRTLAIRIRREPRPIDTIR